MKHEELQILNLAVDTLDKISRLNVNEDIRELLIEEVLRVLDINLKQKRHRPRGELQQSILDTLKALGQATAKQIADNAHLDKNAVSSSLTRMENQGIVERQPADDENGKQGRGRQVESIFKIAPEYLGTNIEN